MMLPALMTWPPYIFTPRRLASESRPLRVLPPAFLCAMSSILLLGYQAEKSGLDTGDFDLGEPLAVAHTLHVVLTATELDDADFIVTTLGDYFSHNGSAGY